MLHAHLAARLEEIDQNNDKAIRLAAQIECRCHTTFNNDKDCIRCQLKKKLDRTTRLLDSAIRNGEG